MVGITTGGRAILSALLTDVCGVCGSSLSTLTLSIPWRDQARSVDKQQPGIRCVQRQGEIAAGDIAILSIYHVCGETVQSGMLGHYRFFYRMDARHKRCNFLGIINGSM